MTEHQDKYDTMMQLAELFDQSGEEMRERSRLGHTILADEAVSDSAELSRKTFDQAEEDILAATTGKHGLMVRSVELDADALIVRATVLTYRWIDDLRDAAYRTLGSIAARAVGYLAPEVELGGAIFSAGLIETDALDRDEVATYLNELADQNPELMDHFVSGGGGLAEGLQMRSLLTAAVLGGPDGAAATRGGLRAVGAPDFTADFGSALRDVAGGYTETDPGSEPGPETGAQAPGAAPDRSAPPGSVEDLIASLTRVGDDLAVQELPGSRFIAYLPNTSTSSRNGDTEPGAQLVRSDVSGRVREAVASLERAIGDQSGARVMLVGHGQGGLTAAEVAVGASSPKFVVDQVVTAGAPSAQAVQIPDGMSLLALEDRSDPVALLGSLINTKVSNRLTVVFDGGDQHGPETYVAGARAADTAKHPDLKAAVQRIRELGYFPG